MLSGPGGVGKGTIVERLVPRHPALWLSRSWTTRARRPGEPEDAYVFVDRPTFQARIDAGGFLEWAPFLDYLQGTPLPDPPPGSDVLLEIDVKGARQVKALYPDAVLIFVDAPSVEDQRRRLEGRGDPPERVAQRLEVGERERVAARELGMHHVLNDDVDAAVERIERLLQEARAARGGRGSRA